LADERCGCGSARRAYSLTIGRTLRRTPRRREAVTMKDGRAGKRPARRWLIHADANARGPSLQVSSGGRPRNARHSRTGPRGTRRRRFCRAASVCPNVIDVDRAVLRTDAPRYSHATKAAARSCRSRTSRTLAARGKSPKAPATRCGLAWSHPPSHGTSISSPPINTPLVRSRSLVVGSTSPDLSSPYANQPRR
jgi:hypothetical protein